jgi:hypothetical protein
VPWWSEVDDQLELRRLFDGEIRWLRTFENLVDVDYDASPSMLEIRLVAQAASNARSNVAALLEDQARRCHRDGR